MMFTNKIGMDIIHNLNKMRKSIMNFVAVYLTISLTVFSPLFLTSCITLFPDDGKHPQKIVLSPMMQTHSPSNIEDSPHKTGQKKCIIDKNIAISKPTAATFDESNRMVIYYDQDNLHLMDHVAGSTYQDNLPDLVQRHMVETLIASKRFRAIGFDTDSFQKDFILELDIQQFAIFAQDQNSRAKVTISGKLLSANGRKPQWQKVFSAETPLSQQSLKAYVIALNQAYARVLTDITMAISAR